MEIWISMAMTVGQTTHHHQNVRPATKPEMSTSSIVKFYKPWNLLLFQRLHVFHDVDQFLLCEQLLHVGWHQRYLLFHHLFDGRLLNRLRNRVGSLQSDTLGS